MNLILFFKEEIETSDRVVLTKKEARAKHIVGHLRKCEGEKIRIGIVDGCIGIACVTKISGDIVELTIDRPRLRAPAARTPVEIILALPYPKTMKALWPVLTSLGVERIHIVVSALSDPDYAKSSAISPEVYTPLILEGLAQAGDTRQPSVNIATHENALDQLIRQGKESDSCLKLLFDLGDFPSVRQVLSSQPLQRVICAIGPERGWTDDEASAFAAAHFSSVSIGQSILRTDVACVAGLALINDALLEIKTSSSQRKH